MRFCWTGITSGADIVAAVALGARSTLRPRLPLRLMAGGEAGVERAIEILSSQVSRMMRLLGDEPRRVEPATRDAAAAARAPPFVMPAETQKSFIHTGHTSNRASRSPLGLCAESESLANRDVT
jgi:hypothetical protein